MIYAVYENQGESPVAYPKGLSQGKLAKNTRGAGITTSRLRIAIKEDNKTIYRKDRSKKNKI